jgi:isopentenyl-diphosphate delta-isomerase
VGSENEICGTLIGHVPESFQTKLVEDEISEVKWLSSNELYSDMEKNPQIYCPWMVAALYLLPESEKEMMEKHGHVLEKWIGPEFKPALEKSLNYHFPTKNWRLSK